jgi:hypothetical protein
MALCDFIQWRHRETHVNSMTTAPAEFLRGLGIQLTAWCLLSSQNLENGLSSPEILQK